MEQLEIDTLCVNTQTEIGQQATVLVDLIEAQDVGAITYATNLLHLNNLMRAIKDHDVDNDDLTDDQMMAAQENIHRIVRAQRNFHNTPGYTHYYYFRS